MEDKEVGSETQPTNAQARLLLCEKVNGWAIQCKTDNG